MDRLDTTNLLLAVLAIASVIQMLVVLAIVVRAHQAYQSVTDLIESKLTPSILRLEGLLANLEHTAAVVRTRTEDVDNALVTAHHAASRLGDLVRRRVAAIAKVAEGVRGAVRHWRAARDASDSVKVVAG